MKLPWPKVFAQGDAKTWLDEFERICDFNGVIADTERLAALATMLTGRAKAAFLLESQRDPDANYQSIREVLIEEFSKEHDRQRALDGFFTTIYDPSEDAIVHYHRLLQQLSLALPEANAATRKRLVRQRFIQSLPADIKEKIEFAVACGVEDMEPLVACTQRILFSMREYKQQQQQEQPQRKQQQQQQHQQPKQQNRQQQRRNVRWQGHHQRWMMHQPGTTCRPLHRRVPQKLEPELQKQVADMLTMGIIQKTKSPYASPIVMVRKADGTYRFCVDFRELNRITIKDALPMPTAEEIFAHLYQAKVISLIDLRSGYWQLPMSIRDRGKTAFCVNGQQYEFLRMPFGLCNAPATFRRLLLKLLDGMDGVTVYGDDIVVYTKTNAEHTAKLKDVFQRIRTAGLKLNSKKCQFARTSIVCLGHIVGCGQIRPLPEKLETIENYPAPKSKRQLRSFLGLVGYDSKFVPHFPEKSFPPFQQLQKDKKFDWTPELEMAFNDLKKSIACSPKCLTIPNPNEKFTVSVDASDIGIGAVLSQPSGVIEYASRVLTTAERKYSTTEKECLAIVWALEKWRTYLLATEFIVKTDHKPLTWLMTTRDPRGRLARWALRLQEFNFTTQHIHGRDNYIPDALSRPCQETDDLPKEVIPVNHLTVLDEGLASHQQSDAVTQDVLRHLRAKTRPKPTSPELRELLRSWNKLSETNGILVAEVEVHASLRPRRVPYVPVGQRTGLLEMAHDRVHLGRERVYDLLKRRVFWPQLRRDVEDFVRTCSQCQQYKNTANQTPPLQSITADEVAVMWGLDIFGPLPTSRNGNRYILVMVDHFTRWVEAIPTADQTGETVARAFKENVIARFGIPDAVITDQGPCFESKSFQDMLRSWGVKRRRTSPYHPQANGVTERFNRTLKEWLSSHNTDWEEKLPEVLFNYRITKHSSTQVAPFVLVYGREARTLLDVYTSNRSAMNLVDGERQRLAQAARDLSHLTHQRNKQRYDEINQTTKWSAYKPGDLVREKDHGRPETTGPGASKFRRKWKGPFIVLEGKGALFKINQGPGGRWVNAKNLAPWYRRGSQTKGGAGVVEWQSIGKKQTRRVNPSRLAIDEPERTTDRQRNQPNRTAGVRLEVPLP
jgi:transposase InsO family protein